MALSQNFKNAAIVWALALSGISAGCSLYRSPDRDYFDSNALAGAPTPKPSATPAPIAASGLQPLSSVCEPITDMLVPLEESQISIRYFSDRARVELITPSPSGDAVLSCHLEFVTPASESELRAASRAQVERWLRDSTPD